MRIHGSTFENSIVVYNPEARLLIDGGNFGRLANISAKGESACSMELNGGEFLGKITNTGKTAFIKGGKFHFQRTPADQYIHPEYLGWNDEGIAWYGVAG